MALNPGTRLGSYEILSLIGAGGMGEVYRARDARLARDVAIKTISPRLAGGHGELARFEREGLRGPAVVCEASRVEQRIRTGDAPTTGLAGNVPRFAEPWRLLG